MIGAAIAGFRSGYTSPPLLSFFDSCDKGYGLEDMLKLKMVQLQVL